MFSSFNQPRRLKLADLAALAALFNRLKINKKLFPKDLETDQVNQLWRSFCIMTRFARGGLAPPRNMTLRV